ncbi:MAG: cysteate synthase [Nitrospirae bacterium RBG_16_43_8]|nr:MAG: cysteate synthase [Nitrospirae bacterium RBG_16_43_8]
MSHFNIKCRHCGKELRKVYCSFCEHCKDALLVTRYKDEKFSEDNEKKGIWRFNWIPVHGTDFEQSGTLVYKSEKLSGYLGVENLYIAFNGFWPEKGASLQTCTFKEIEAAVVLQNARENDVEGLIVASAGNTARALAHLSIVSGFPVVIVVPTCCLAEMWYLESSSLIPTLAVGDGDYSDSIDVAKRIAQVVGFPFEGGVKNIAKRDGLGIVLLEAVAVMKRLPDHYFQAVGSGTGAIGVWEMSERFLKDGRFGSSLPVLHLAQNKPFMPMVNAWKKKSRWLSPDDLRSELIEKITTRVLSTRYPAYSIQGGVYDALKATNGRMYGVSNSEVYKAMDLFENIEGIDIVPASGVAVGALINAVKDGIVKNDETILLNITGGGEKKLGHKKKTYNVQPRVISKKITEKEIEELLCPVLKKNS